MRYLVDTHILIWWVTAHKKLKSSIHQIIRDPQNEIFVSVMSGVEISIKRRTRKLRLKTTTKECFAKSGFEVLHVTLPHALELDTFPTYHKDPFDRILIAQARAEGITFITSDKKIWQYDVAVLKS